MSDQISRLNMSGIQASVMSVKDLRGQHMADSSDENMDDDDFNVDVDFHLCEEKKLRDGNYHIVLRVTAERKILR